MSFEERLRGVLDSLRKQKEAHASTRPELELWKARMAKLQSTVGDFSVDADVGPQVTCNEQEGVHISREMGSPGHNMPHMGVKNMGTTCVSPMGKSHSAVEWDVDKDVGVHTEGLTIPHAIGFELPGMETKVEAADEAVSSLPGAQTVKGGDGNILRTSGVDEIATVVEERIGTTATATKLSKAGTTPPLDEQHCSTQNAGLASRDKEDVRQAEEV